jgi:hypothetical protein
VGKTFFPQKKRGLKEVKTTGTRNSLKADTLVSINIGLTPSGGKFCNAAAIILSDDYQSIYYM